jgi:predicted AlkP superfamily pyrophosphatase or phosphodiesterase
MIVDAAAKAFGGKPADRAFIYNPDAVALWLFQKYLALFRDALLETSLQLPVSSVMPSVTPVCFASMYTGAPPEVHGIRTYLKPVLKTDTLFDAAIRANLRPAIVSTEGDSISKIFLEREMDYFLFRTPEECNAKALDLIAADRHDLIVLYNGNYDATMHRFGPESEEALTALSENIRTFTDISRAIDARWTSHRTLLGFCPDHGCHEIDGSLGSHGLDMPEDMNVVHMFRFVGAQS